MPVLKQYQSTPAMREAIVLDLGDIGAQAARIRAAAETRAQQIIAKAQAKAEEIAQQRGDEAEQLGYAEGRERGLAEGREQGKAEALGQYAEQLRQLAAGWSQVATDWEQQRTEMEREARQAVLDFALRTAEKIVHRVIEVDESVVVDQAAQALSMVLSSHDASVHLHPVDRPVLEDALPELISELANLKHIELVEDESITPGGCVVTFGQGKVDATIEKQMQRLVDLILPEPPAPAYDEPELDESADDSATAQAQAALDPGSIAPVFEITDQGLVEKNGAASVSTDHAQATPDEGPAGDEAEDPEGGAS